MEWLKVAQTLPVGGKTQIECPDNCGSGKKLSVVHDVKEYWCNCFRCGYTSRHSKGVQTLADIQRIKELNEAAKQPVELKLPEDFTHDIPLEGRLWLYRASLTEVDWRASGFGYSESLQRVVLPVFDGGGVLQWFQARALHKGQEPKYLQPSEGRECIVYSGHTTSPTYTTCVLTEDILSARRVGEHIDAYSLLGTKITTSQAAYLGQYDRVIVWLDPDRAGRKGSYNIRKTLGLITDVCNIVTDKDPKELTRQQIKDQLQKVLEHD